MIVCPRSFDDVCRNRGSGRAAARAIHRHALPRCRKTAVRLSLASRDEAFTGFRIERYKIPVSRWDDNGAARDAIAKSFRTTIATMASPGKISREGVRPFGRQCGWSRAREKRGRDRVREVTRDPSRRPVRINRTRYEESRGRIPRGGRGPCKDVSRGIDKKTCIYDYTRFARFPRRLTSTKFIFVRAELSLL